MTTMTIIAKPLKTIVENSNGDGPSMGLALANRQPPRVSCAAGCRRLAALFAAVGRRNCGSCVCPQFTSISLRFLKGKPGNAYTREKGRKRTSTKGKGKGATPKFHPISTLQPDRAHERTKRNESAWTHPPTSDVYVERVRANKSKLQDAQCS